MKVGIVGGGIGGLTTAIALAREGHEVELYEQAPGFEQIGAGVVVGANAKAILDLLGVSLAGIGAVFDRFEARDGHGDVLNVMRTGDDLAIGVTRGVLHDRLLAALPAAVRVHVGTAVREVRQDADGAYLAGRRYDVVVGADGLRSTIRRQIAGPIPLSYSGQTCWRWQATYDTGPVATEWWGPGRRVGAVPVGDGETYLYAVADAPAGRRGPGSPVAFHEMFDVLPAAQEAVETAKSVPVLHHDLYEVSRPSWGKGRIVLIGDAAHAMTPNLGQGAAMAIEDAAALAFSLRYGIVGLPTRLAHGRDQRVRAVALMSRTIGRQAQSSSTWGRRIRDLAFRATPQFMGDLTYQRLVRPGYELARRLANLPVTS